MEVLKRKRMYEKQRVMAREQPFNIDQASFGIELAKANVQTVATRKATNVNLKKTLKNDFDIDKVECLANGMANMNYEFNPIDEALRRSFSTQNDTDQANLDAELELLEDDHGEQTNSKVAIWTQ
jgi:Snf7